MLTGRFERCSALTGRGVSRRPCTAERDGRFMRYRLVGATVRGTTLAVTCESGMKVVISLG